MAGDVISMIVSDHREMERMFGLMMEDPGVRPLVLPLAVAVVTAHGRAEADHVYPVLAAEAGGQEEARHSAAEHEQAEQLGRLLLESGPSGESFAGRLEEFMNTVLSHVRAEEQDLLPVLAHAVSGERLQAIGASFAARRTQELTGRRPRDGQPQGDF